MKLISLVFSFRNEEENLKTLVDRVHKAVEKTTNWNYELVFVNDDSTDNSEKILIDLQKNFPIKIINMSRNFGNNPCVLAGFENSLGDCIVYMDSDLQDPPELITELISKLSTPLSLTTFSSEEITNSLSSVLSSDSEYVFLLFFFRSSVLQIFKAIV